MNNSENPRNTSQHVSVQQIGSEMLVYDERHHKAFCLNECSGMVFRLADGARTVSEIRAAASVELKAPISEELVLLALQELRRDGLIEPSATAAHATKVSRRAILQRLGVGGALLLPAISAIVAPTAAQAYSGCVDCSVSQGSTTRRQSVRQ